MDVTLLRTLARRSVLGFGKQSNSTVEELLNTNKKEYLAWVYFNCSNISFLPDILDDLCIEIPYRFPKPAKNVDLWKAWKARLDGNRTEEELEQRKRMYDIGQKRKLKRYGKQDKRFLSRDNLRRKNQGK